MQQTCRQEDMQTGRQADRQTGRQTDRLCKNVSDNNDNDGVTWASGHRGSHLDFRPKVLCSKFCSEYLVSEVQKIFLFIFVTISWSVCAKYIKE
jgi:hypothetical protein